VVLLATWLIYFTLSERRARAHFETVLRAADAGNIPAMLAEYLTTVRGVSQQTSEMQERVLQLHDVFPNMIRHVGLIRFTPFHDTGGDQSFALALLNSDGDGVVISALHSRASHKVYAKPVRNRASTYPLTDEEQRAIADSMAVDP